MYAIKNAILIKEKYPETEVTILYMDIRAYGKGYEEYYQRAVDAGVHFVRGLPAEILDRGDTLALRVENTESGEILDLKPELVVLSVGLQASIDSGDIATLFGIPREDTGFLKPLDDKIETVATIRPGIYLAGTATQPRDIPDCVAHAGAAAMRAFLDANKDGSSR
jgi:heterodisulfide reductase subunit A